MFNEGVGPRTQPRPIHKVHRVADSAQPFVEADGLAERVAGDELAQGGGVPAGAHVVEVGEWRAVRAGELRGIAERAVTLCNGAGIGGGAGAG